MKEGLMKSKDDIEHALKAYKEALNKRRAAIRSPEEEEKELIASMEGYIKALVWVLEN